MRLLWSSLISIVRYWTIWSMPQWFVILYWLGILICINIFIITISIKTIYAVFSYFWWGGRCLNTICLMSRKIPHRKPLQHLATDFVRCQHPILNIPIFISIGNMQIGRIQDCWHMHRRPHWISISCLFLVSIKHEQCCQIFE